MDAANTLNLVPLCTAQVQLGEGFDLGVTPFGAKRVGELASATFEGERFKARMVGAAAADWFTSSSTGDFGAVDVRMTLKTDDEAIILLSYRGRLDLSDMANGIYVFVAPLFVTGDPRYAWINLIQAVGKGLLTPQDGKIHYSFFEVR